MSPRSTLLALVLLAPLAACRTTHVLSPDAVVIELPQVRQNELWECGLVSLDALTRHFGVEWTQAERARLQRLAHERKGLSADELAEQLRGLGFETFVFEGKLDRSEVGLLRHVDAGRPMIVMTKSLLGERHFVLAHGYDEPQRLICLLDPLNGELIERWDDFDDTWARAGRLTLLALPLEPTARAPRDQTERRDSPARH